MFTCNSTPAVSAPLSLKFHAYSRNVVSNHRVKFHSYLEDVFTFCCTGGTLPKVKSVSKYRTKLQQLKRFYKLYNVVLVRARRIFSRIRDFLKGDICQFIITIHGKVMFSQASVILFTGGVCGRHAQARLPPAQCMLGHTDTPTQCMLGYTSPPAVTAADGTHPT